MFYDHFSGEKIQRKRAWFCSPEIKTKALLWEHINWSGQKCPKCRQGIICINMWKSSHDHICIKLLGICAKPWGRQRSKQGQIGWRVSVIEKEHLPMNVIVHLISWCHAKTLMHPLKAEPCGEWHLGENQRGTWPEAAMSVFGSCKENNCLAANYLVESL